jgi:hypothetical protein
MGYKAYSAGQTVPSTVQIRAEGNNTKCVGKKRFNGSVRDRAVITGACVETKICSLCT